MKDRQPLGDVPPAEFRRQLHELADWIADYRKKIETLPVAPNAKPGAIIGALPKQAPDDGEPLDRIFADIQSLIVPGMVHWGHPMFLGYFGWTTTAPGILGEIITAPLNVNSMTWRTSPAAT
jgi:aromatic-L-amino-acid decarboxylase